MPRMCRNVSCACAHGAAARSLAWVLFCYTASHRTAPLEVVGRLGRSASEAGALLDAPLDGHVLLSTCNRFEVYADGDAFAGDAVVRAIGRASGLDRATVRAAGTLLYGDAVAEHAFAVASGLESLVLGEAEIAGQLRRACEAARARGSVTQEIDRVFEHAARAARQVRRRTALGRTGRSAVQLGLDVAQRSIGDWASARVLLLGTGRYAATALAALRRRGVRDVRVFSPSGRQAGFAADHGVRAETDLVTAVGTCDLVVACSAVPTAVVGVRELEAARAAAASDLVIVDLGLPRNVAATAALVPGVELIDLDALRASAPAPQPQAVADARMLLADALAGYRRARAEEAAAPALRELRAQVTDLLEQELARTRRRGGDAGTEQALRHLVGVLLHAPSVRGRELAAQGRSEEFAAAVATLFGAAPPTVSQSRSAGSTTLLNPVTGWLSSNAATLRRKPRVSTSR